MRNIYTSLSLFVFVILAPLSVHSESLSFLKQIELDELYFMTIDMDEGNNVSVSIYFGDKEDCTLVERYIVGNAAIHAEDIKILELDESNDTLEYLVSINDKTSNYGARTGVLIYKKSWWRLVKIPTEKYKTLYETDQIIFELNNDKYIFTQGNFVKLN